MTITTTATTTAPDTLAANKALAVRWLDLISTGDVEELVRTAAPTWVMFGGPPSLPTGHTGIRGLIASFGRIRQSWEIEDVIAEGDRVVVRAVNHCVQEEFFGIPAAGIEQVFTATITFQIVDGLVTTIWRNAADLQRVIQLGARILPPKYF